MYKFLIIYFLLLTSFLTVVSQTATPAQQINRNKFIDGSSQIGRGAQLGVFDNRYEGIKGSSFLYDEWKMGSVTLAAGQTIDSLLLKYDAYTNELVLKKGEKMQSFMTIQITSFALENSHHFKKYDIPNAKTPHGFQQFYEVLHEGTHTLIRQPVKLILGADTESAFNSGRNYDEFIDKEFYYLKKSDVEFVRIKLSKKALTKALPTYSKAVKKLMKEYDWNLSNPEDVVKLFAELER